MVVSWYLAAIHAVSLGGETGGHSSTGRILFAAVPWRVPSARWAFHTLPTFYSLTRSIAVS
jgi:hypothetical protein